MLMTDQLATIENILRYSQDFYMFGYADGLRLTGQASRSRIHVFLDGAVVPYFEGFAVHIPVHKVVIPKKGVLVDLHVEEWNGKLCLSFRFSNNVVVRPPLFSAGFSGERYAHMLALWRGQWDSAVWWDTLLAVTSDYRLSFESSDTERIPLWLREVSEPVGVYLGDKKTLCVLGNTFGAYLRSKRLPEFSAREVVRG